MDEYHSGHMSNTEYGYVCSLEELIDRKLDRELEDKRNEDTRRDETR